MIPKIIHYCWFGGNPLDETAKKCIESWKIHCPDYEIIEWNEANFDINCCQYIREAYDAKKWAFVTDYARLKVVYENGGIYLDTDVEILKPLDDLLSNTAFFGFQNENLIATGLGFGAQKGCEILNELMLDYKDVSFCLPNGTYDLTPCPERNSEVFIKYGFKMDNSLQVLDGVVIYPSEYFCPKNSRTLKLEVTKNTYTIHHFAGTWISEKTNHRQKIKKLLGPKLCGWVVKVMDKLGIK